MQPRQTDPLSQVKPFIIGPRPKIVIPLNKIKIPEGPSNPSTPQPDERVVSPAKLKQIKSEEDETEMEDLNECSEKDSSSKNIIISPQREPSRGSRKSVSISSPANSVKTSSVVPTPINFPQSHKYNRNTKLISCKNSMLSSVFSAKDLHVSQIDQQSPTNLKGQPQQKLIRHQRRGSVEPPKSHSNDYISRFIRKRYNEMINRPKKDERVVIIPKKSTNTCMSHFSRTSSVLMSPRKPLTTPCNKNDEVLEESKPTIKKAMPPSKGATKQKEKPKTVIINLENLERITGKKKLYNGGLSKKILKISEIKAISQEKGIDKNANAIYLYLV